MHFHFSCHESWSCERLLTRISVVSNDIYIQKKLMLSNRMLKKLSASTSIRASKVVSNYSYYPATFHTYSNNSQTQIKCIKVAHKNAYSVLFKLWHNCLIPISMTQVQSPQKHTSLSLLSICLCFPDFPDVPIKSLIHVQSAFSRNIWTSLFPNGPLLTRSSIWEPNLCPCCGKPGKSVAVNNTTNLVCCDGRLYTICIMASS